MEPLTPVLIAAAGLLLVAGAAKVVRPADTSQALRTQGLPSRPVLVRVLGGAEVLAALAALLELPFAAALLAAAYAAFTAFVLTALVRDRPLSSCGCFAEPDVPPTPVHAVLTAVLAACCAGAAAGAGGGLPDLLGAPLATAGGAVLSAGLLGWLSYLVMARLPRLLAELLPLPSAPTAGAHR